MSCPAAAAAVVVVDKTIHPDPGHARRTLGEADEREQGDDRLVGRPGRTRQGKAAATAAAAAAYDHDHVDRVYELLSMKTEPGRAREDRVRCRAVTVKIVERPR